MTDKENNVFQLLVQSWNNFLELPEENNHDTAEFRFLIHQAQARILMRPARRKFNNEL